MNDLNMMMRDQARLGLQAQLDAAVTNGDTAAATKIADDIAKLAVQSAPKAPPYGDAEVRAQLEKTPWYGIDPKKSAKALEFGKTMDIKKFATAELFAAALVKAVDDEFKPAGRTAPEEETGDETDEEREAREAEEAEAAGTAPPKPKRKTTDGPGEGDTNGVRPGRKTTGPWVKLTDAPAETQKEIKRSADKFVSSSAPKEQREKFISKALESHYLAAQRAKGKK